MLKQVLGGFLIILTIIMTSVPSGVHAVINTPQYSVKVVIPENQKDKVKSYFDLHMEPGDMQTLTIVLKNPTDKEVTINANVNTAMTNPNGVIDYSQTKPKLDKTMVHSIGDLAHIQNLITIPPNEEVTVPIHLEIPDRPFNGVLLGGIYLQKQDTDSSESEKSSEGVQIENKVARVIGLVVSVGNTDSINPDLKLNEITPTQFNYRNVVTANIQNVEANYLKDFKIEAKVYKGKSKKVLHETTKDGLRLAPNSNFDFPISWGNKKFKPGTYRLELKAISDKKTWEWTKKFTIKDVDKLNKQMIQEKDHKMLYLLCSVIGIIVIILIIWLYKRKKREDSVE